MTEGILTLLRAGTQEAHTKLEQYVDMPARAGDLPRYENLVEAFLGWYEPMERSLAEAGDWSPTGYLPAERAKSGWLVSDLRALGRAPEEIAALPRCAALPKIDSLAAGFGCAYVMEGATLGGRAITALLAGRVPEEGRSFFRSYGEATRERWLQFLASVDRFAETQGGKDQIVEAAAESFRSFESWLRQCDERSKAAKS